MSFYILQHTQLLFSECIIVLQIVIASVMCGYSEADWTELCKQAEVCTLSLSHNVTHLLSLYSSMLVLMLLSSTSLVPTEWVNEEWVLHVDRYGEISNSRHKMGFSFPLSSSET